MLLSKAKILIAAAGLAMLAIPVTALAGHKHDDFRTPRSFAAHPQRSPSGGQWALRRSLSRGRYIISR